MKLFIWTPSIAPPQKCFVSRCERTRGSFSALLQLFYHQTKCVQLLHMQHTSANVMWFAGVLSEHSALTFYTDISVTITLLCRGAQSWRLFVSSDIRPFCRERPAVLLFYGPVSSLQTLRLPWFFSFFSPSKIKRPLQTESSCWLFSSRYTWQQKRLNDVCCVTFPQHVWTRFSPSAAHGRARLLH